MADEPGRPAWRRAWAWMWEPSPRTLRVLACPRCATAVVVRVGRPERALDRLKPPEEPSEGELLAACPDHGWPPYNERSTRLRDRTA